MRIIIIGAGRVGRNLAKELSREGHDVSLLEADGPIAAQKPGTPVSGYVTENKVVFNKTTAFIKATADPNKVPEIGYEKRRVPTNDVPSYVSVTLLESSSESVAVGPDDVSLDRSVTLPQTGGPVPFDQVVLNRPMKEADTRS